MSLLTPPSFCITVLADADPTILIRLIERVQSLSIIPHQLSAQWLPDDQVTIGFICAGLDAPGMDALVARISQFTTVHSATWTVVARRA